MSLTMHQATVPTCTRALNNLAAILEKAATYAETRNIDPKVLLQTRLYPDMLPLSTQIYIANDIAGGGAARLAGAPVPAFDGKDKTLAELIAATRSTVEYLALIQAAAIRRCGSAHGELADSYIYQKHARHALSLQSRAAQCVLPCDHGLRHIAAGRPRNRQAGLLGQRLGACLSQRAPPPPAATLPASTSTMVLGLR